jgi:sugar lactone lactonase YvrE
VLVADTNNHRLRQVTTDGVVTTFAGSGSDVPSDGPRLDAGLLRPWALARDGVGRIYVAGGSSQVRRIELDGTVVTVAGDGSRGFADAEDPMSARFFGMEGIDVTPDGRFLYIADGTGGTTEPYHRVRRLQIQGEP